ncbi:Pectate trisaccharide-lyase OS=Streptomyces antimycoticus OX=68175 GN=pelA PE=3 SV=1 [Streptomyces antimycoticus]
MEAERPAMARAARRRGPHAGSNPRLWRGERASCRWEPGAFAEATAADRHATLPAAPGRRRSPQRGQRAGQNGTYGGRDGRTVTVRTPPISRVRVRRPSRTPSWPRRSRWIPRARRSRSPPTRPSWAGTSGQIIGGLFLGQGVHNVIIRNLTIRDSYEGTWNDKEHDWDAIQMDGAHHVRIDHNELRHMADGLIDSRKRHHLPHGVLEPAAAEQQEASGSAGRRTPRPTSRSTTTGSARASSATRPPTTSPMRICTTTTCRTTPARTSAPPTATTLGKTPRWCWRTAYFQGFENPVIKDATAALLQRGNALCQHHRPQRERRHRVRPEGGITPTSSTPPTGVPSIVTSGSGPTRPIGTTG